MNQCSLTNVEYQKLVDRLEFDDTTRNQLLTFSFTTVLAVLGVALGVNLSSSLSATIFLIPYLLIIPFEARISYYRLESAQINTFLSVFAGEKQLYYIGSVKEDKCKHYGLIAWLVNNEMVLLGIATGIVFYIKYIPSVKVWDCLFLFPLILPVIAETIIIIITEATIDYGYLNGLFETNWTDYKKMIEHQ